MIKKITTLLFTFLLCSVSYYSMTNAGGPGPEYSNAPSESNCANSSCHGGSVITSGSNWDNLKLTSNFTGNGYIPDSTYTIKISYNQSSISTWGFQVTILDASNKKAGTISGSSSRVQIFSSSGLSRDYAGHTSNGTSSTGTNATDWSFTWRAPNKNIGTVKAYVTLNAANGDNGSGGDAIYGKIFSIAPSGLLPVADAKSNDSVSCAGFDVALKGNSTNIDSKSTWSWSLSGASPNNSTSQSPTIKYNNPGTFWAVLTAKNSKGASKADSLKIIVRSKPSVNITGPNAYTFCKGDSVTLSATQNSNYSYTWSPTGSVNRTVVAKDTGSYFVTVKDQNKCTNTAGPVKITHHPFNTVSISRDVTNDTVCFEKAVTFTASGTTTFNSFSYFNKNGLILTTSDNPFVLQMSGSNDIFIKGEDSKGCLTPASNTLSFVVKNALSTPVAACKNKTTGGFEIGWGAVTNALGYKVSLDTGKTWEDPSSGTTGLSHTVLGFPSNTDILVLVKALDIFPCYESPVGKVVCGSIPCSPLSYDIVWNKDVCKGNDIQFKIRNLTTNYFSLKLDNGVSFKDTAFSVTSDFTRTYKFELTDSANLSCPTIKRDAAVAVWEIPSVAFTSDNKQNIFCDGLPATFEAAAKGMQEYDFFVNGVSKNKGKVSSWIYNNPKNLDSVWVVIKNGACQETSGKLKLGISSFPTAAFTHSFSGKKATFTAGETGSAKFKWDFGDGMKDTLTKNPVHDYGPGGLTSVWVKLTVINDFGCTSVDSLQMSIPASIGKSFNEYGIHVYPQPAKNSFKIELPAELVYSKIVISDLNGKVVYTAGIDKRISEILTDDLVNGVYVLSLQKNHLQLKGKVIISR